MVLTSTCIPTAFLVLVVAVASDCKGVHVNQPDDMTLVVATFNIQGNKDSVAACGPRMVEMAQGLRSDIPGIFSILGVQESRYTNSWTGPMESLSVSYQVDEPIPCPGGGTRFAAQCLAHHLGVDYQRNATVSRGNAVIAQSVFDILDAQNIQLEREADVPLGAIVRTMQFARLRYNVQNHRFTGKTIPVFSIHTVPKSGPLDQQKRQVQKIVDKAKELWKSGDSPPLLIGDFNCGAWNREIRRILFEYFYEASGQDSVDMVLVGRPEKWPLARPRQPGDLAGPGGTDWVLVPTEPKVAGRYDALAAGLSDHMATWVTLVWRPAGNLGMNYSHTVPDNYPDGCWPAVGYFRDLR